jgi:diguanylate cyclase (GGDEF)-like protein
MAGSMTQDDVPLGARARLSYVVGGPRGDAALGTALAGVCAVVMASTVEALRPDARSLVVFFFAALAVIVVSTLMLWRLPWSSLPRQALLAFPLVALGGLTVASALAPGLADAYGGFFLLAFVYVGITQPPGTSFICVLLALPAWVVCEGRLSALVDVKMPITLVLWLLVGELLSRRTRNDAHATRMLAKAASTDHLTGLYSRRELDRALSATSPGDALVMLDIDSFKRVNDEQGHDAGDKVLADFGATVMAGMRSGDIAVRYGGDEVLLLLARAGRSGASTYLERLRAEWSREDRPTFSAGAALHDSGSYSIETLQKADRALYAAKHSGGDALWVDNHSTPRSA